ncbi:MAG: gamma-glutamyltransferase family protein [Pseudomonadota bacterium]
MLSRLLIFVMTLMLPAVVQAQTLAAPEAASDRATNAIVRAKRHMIVAANPYASDAGHKILRAGGSAVDAAIAAQLVLNLVEPQSSGLGGSGFLLHWDKQATQLTSYDGRETAPASARPDRFLQDGQPVKFRSAMNSGASIGVPGVTAMLADAHRQHGKLAWRALFQPAIDLATAGFVVSPRLNALLKRSGADYFTPPGRRYFFDDAGEPRPVGYLLRNPEFAKTLRTIAERGPNAVHGGEIGQAIVAAAASATGLTSGMTPADLANYRAIVRPSVCAPYRGYRVCGMGPPSSGALTVAQALLMLERFDLGTSPADAANANAVHLIAQAQRLAFADRKRYMADPDHAPIPSGLLDPAYLTTRAQLINPERAAERVTHGLPPGLSRRGYGRDHTIESAGTTHISIVDAAGNAVSMTTSVGTAFGSGVWAAGFLLNNELTDFSFRPTDDDGTAIANAVEPGKRPRSSMNPTIVFGPDKQLFAVLGSPGGSRIILYVMKGIIGLIDWKLDAQQAADLLNFGNRSGPLEIEKRASALSGGPTLPWQDAPAPWFQSRLEPLGHTIRPVTTTSGLHVIVRRNGSLFGGADPRREGVARGDD